MMLTESDIINGQLVPQRLGQAYNPRAYGPVMSNTRLSSPPTIPPVYAAGMAGGSSGGALDVAAAGAAAAPFSFTKSPLPIAIVCLVVGMLLLRYVHWR